VGLKRIFVHGLGAVSPAGWGVEVLCDVVQKNGPLPITDLPRPGWNKPLRVRAVPAPPERPTFLAHPRLRRASTITQHTVAAALEALGEDAAPVQSGALRLGIVISMMPGCVAYSRRFYEEVLKNPTVASPLVFPETVFNAPGSHLASFLNSKSVSYTLVGDESSYVQGLAVAAGWLHEGRVDGALVIGAEELDWIIADAAHLFNRQTIQTGGAGAIYLKSRSRREEALTESAIDSSLLTSSPTKQMVELATITESFTFAAQSKKRAAAESMRSQLPGDPDDLLCLGTQGLPRMDADELAAWRDWPGARIAPRELLGDAFTASAAWQCVVACAALRRGGFAAANVSVVGTNAQAIGARFQKVS
jgi:hypothetical protein